MKTRASRMENGGLAPLFSTEFGLRRHVAALQSADVSAHSKTRRLLLLCLLISAFCLLAWAQQYSIDWYKVAGGGGTSTGGTYAVSGTIGQHDAGGPMTGGSYSLTGGFWALISVVQMPGAPTLYISQSGNTVTVYWQAVSGWSLQQNSNLAATNGWLVNSSWTATNGTNSLTISNPTSNLFFRLSNP